MKFYHRTRKENAARILESGFIDQEGLYMTPYPTSGVWLSNTPLDENEGAFGDALLTINIPIAQMRDFEWIEEGKPYREFQAPAELVNRYKASLRIEHIRQRRPDDPEPKKGFY